MDGECATRRWVVRSALRPLNRAVMSARVLPIAQCGPSLVQCRRQPGAANFVDAVARRPLTRWPTEKPSDSAVVVPVRALDNLARNKKSRDGRFDWSMGVDGLRVRRLREGVEACNSFNSPDFWSERRAAERIRLLLGLWLPADSLPARIRGCDASRRPMAPRAV
jgi:hypothetical protein